MKSNYKLNTNLLTPSRAKALHNGDYGFIQSYILDNRQQPTAPMMLGTRVHDLFYYLIKNKLDTSLIK